MRRLVALIALGSIVACGAGSTGVDGEWELVAGALEGVEILPPPSAPGDMAGSIRPILLVIDDDDMTGRAQCNNYGGAIEITERKRSFEFGVEFGDVFSELQGCGEVETRVGTAYFDALLRADRGRLNGDELILAGDGVVLVYEHKDGLTS